MTAPAYPAARLVAGKVRAHFTQHIAAARAKGRDSLATEPDERAIESLIDTAFWASLRREEGLTPRISLGYLPSDSGPSLTFRQSLPLHPGALAKLAPAVERPGIHLGVWPEGDALRVWGTTRTLPPYCFVIEVVASGLLVIKHRSEVFGKFVNVAVLEGDTVKFVDERSATLPECPGLLRSLLGFGAASERRESVNVLVLLAASMRAHGRGGALLVVPAGSATWRESIVDPILYGVEPPFTELAELMRQEAGASTDHEWQEELRRVVDAVAGLTAVDGATLVSMDYALIAFGAKIIRRKGRPPVDSVLVSEPIENSTQTTLPVAQLGGTRHMSAAQFVNDQHDAVALVASQDGKFTIFKWSERDQMVHAHRVEALLL
ncbi:MAG: putative sensor domain DACNV-containing protein [Vicinamibacterales bacterium]